MPLPPHDPDRSVIDAWQRRPHLATEPAWRLRHDLAQAEQTAEAVALIEAGLRRAAAGGSE